MTSQNRPKYNSEDIDCSPWNPTPKVEIDMEKAVGCLARIGFWVIQQIRNICIRHISTRISLQGGSHFFLTVLLYYCLQKEYPSIISSASTSSEKEIVSHLNWKCSGRNEWHIYTCIKGAKCNCTTVNALYLLGDLNRPYISQGLIVPI